jgi:hypothetical protein
MARRVRRVRNIALQPFSIEDFVADTIDEAMEKFAAYAVREKTRATQRYKPSRITTFVGEREGRSEFTVKPGESIRYELNYMKTIVIEAWKLLRLNSPEQTGTDTWGLPPDEVKYKDNHFIFDGQQYYDNPYMIPDDVTEVVLVNPLPYARKVEIHGWKGKYRVSAPYHTYEETVRQMNKYSNVVTVKFTFWQVSGFGVGKYANHRLRSRREASERFPAMIIKLR